MVHRTTRRLIFFRGRTNADETGCLRFLVTQAESHKRESNGTHDCSDDTAEVARGHGAQVVAERVPGYGSAVHAGVVAATSPVVAVIDADGSLDPGDLPRLVAALDGAEMVTGRRRPVRGLRWPWHARLGTAAVE